MNSRYISLQNYRKSTYLTLIFSQICHWQNCRRNLNIIFFNEIYIFLFWFTTLTRDELILFIQIFFFKNIKKTMITIWVSNKAKKERRWLQIIKLIASSRVLNSILDDSISKVEIEKSNRVQKLKSNFRVEFNYWNRNSTRKFDSNRQDSLTLKNFK